MEQRFVSLYVYVQYKYTSCRPDGAIDSAFVYLLCMNGRTWLVSLKCDLGGCRLTFGSYLFTKINISNVLFCYDVVPAHYYFYAPQSIVKMRLCLPLLLIASSDRCILRLAQAAGLPGWGILISISWSFISPLIEIRKVVEGLEHTPTYITLSSTSRCLYLPFKGPMTVEESTQLIPTKIFLWSNSRCSCSQGYAQLNAGVLLLNRRCQCN